VSTDPEPTGHEKPLRGRVALVTGASRGIGKAIAVELGSLGADVAITARTVEPRNDDLTGTIHETAAAVEATHLAVERDPTTRKRWRWLTTAWH